MTCPRCTGLLMPKEAQTIDGAWAGLACQNCGFHADPLMRAHKRTRPEPFRQLPNKPKTRPRPTLRPKAVRRS